MSAYNEVVRSEDEVCERCGSKIRRVVQFKYGDTWQHRFAIGDVIPWGGNDIGEPGHQLVAVIGYPGECSVCGFVPDYTYDVMLKRDRIEDAAVSTGAYDYVGSGGTYVILEP